MTSPGFVSGLRAYAGGSGLRGGTALIALVALLTGCAVGSGPSLPVEQGNTVADGDDTTDPASTPAPATGVEGGAAAFVLVDSLPVKGRAPKTGYDRDAFGPRWADTDRNGCDTRNDVLARDLTDITVRPGTRDCVVLTGKLNDPYTGATIGFEKENASAIHIDHIVSLSNAWQTGAQAWPAAQRLAFANDPLNLLAVDGHANTAKGDADAATWLPPNRAFRCAMVARQVAVKAKYGLWMTPPERDAAARILQSCPDEPAPTSVHPTLAPVRAQ